MGDIFSILVNNGTAIALIAYFFYKDTKFYTTLSVTLVKLEESVNLCKDLITKMNEDYKENKRYGK